MIDPELKACLLTVGADAHEDGRPFTIHLAEKLWAMAIEGDKGAMKMVLDYVIGRPSQSLRDVSDLVRDVDAEYKAALEKVYGPVQLEEPPAVDKMIVLPEGDDEYPDVPFK